MDSQNGHMEATASVAEAAHALKVSERTIRRRCENGKLRARLTTTEAGRTWRIEAAAIVRPMSEAAANGAATIHEEITAEAPDIGQPAAITAATDLARLDADVQQIKSFLAGQMAGPEIIRAEMSAAIAEAFGPLAQKVATLAAENEKLKTQLEAATAPPPPKPSWKFWKK